MTLRIEVPDDSPFFAGHFPGHPILPGIAHLAFVARALGGVAFSEVRTLKLRRPVFPGDVLDLIHQETETGVHFELCRGGEAVSSGSVRPAAERLDSAIRFAPLVRSSFPPPATLIPHAPPSLLVESILDASLEGAFSIAVIPEDSPFVEAGRAPAFVGLEAGAQTAAALEALARTEEGGPRIGYVVGIRDARFHVPWLPAGRPLEVAVKLAGSAPPLSIYQVSLGREAELGIGIVSTYLDPAP